MREPTVPARTIAVCLLIGYSIGVEVSDGMPVNAYVALAARVLSCLSPCVALARWVSAGLISGLLIRLSCSFAACPGS